jgi:hypothetical protein
MTAESSMARKAEARLAIFLWVLALLLAVGSAVLMVLNLPVRSDVSYLALLAPGFSTIGMVIATRRPNMVGWLFLAVGLVGAVGAFTGEYTLRTLQAEPGSLPGGAAMAWVSSWIVLCVLALVLLLLLVFPDGRLPTTRWRPVAWGLVASFGLWILWIMVRPQPIDFEGTKVPNPFGIEVPAYPVIVGEVLGALDFLVVSVTGVASGLAPFVRWRRAGPVERLQFKWLVFVVVAVPLGIAASFASWTVFPAVIGPAADVVLGFVFLAVALAGIPAAVGIAILRHRLYDIDRLINRTLVYGLLTVILGVGYAGVVLVLGQLFGGVTNEPPSWVMAGATLAAAALFQPARRRIQTAVDRRFNRRHYDAAKTIEAFSARLRDQIDLDTLATELHAVVDQTMQPTQASLWLRPAPARQQPRPQVSHRSDG